MENRGEKKNGWKINAFAFLDSTSEAGIHLRLSGWIQTVFLVRVDTLQKDEMM